MSEGATGPADYARLCVRCVVAGTDTPAPPEHALFARPSACFVTLKKRGQLRGCIGTLEPAESGLGAEIVRNARASALHDPRFPPVEPAELDALVVSVDVLGTSEPCGLDDLDPARWGVIVSAGFHRGVLLPDLQGVDTVDAQVAIALQKAGIRADEPFDVERFPVVRYREGDSPAEAADEGGSGPGDG